MSKTFNKKVFGCAGVSVTSSMWNADFSKDVPIMGNGVMRANDTAFKYAQKKYMESNDFLVFGLKSLYEEKGRLLPRTLEQRYEHLFGGFNKESSSIDVYRNLLSCIDIMNFGTTFAVGSQNISITGAVQVFDGINKDEDTQSFDITIQSPFATEKKNQTTLGNKTKLDSAFFVHGFKVNPMQYKDLVDKDIIDGYTEEAYEIFKQSTLCSVTNLDSAIKQGCENTFAIFVECKENTIPNINNLTNYIKYKRIVGKEHEGQLELSSLINYLKCFDNKIDKIELYYDPFILELKVDNKQIGLSKIYEKEIIIINNLEVNLFNILSN